METFVRITATALRVRRRAEHDQTVFDFLTRTKTHHKPDLEDDTGQHGGGDQGLSRTFVRAVAEKDQSLLGVTPEEILNSHLLVFAAEEARKQGRVVDFGQFKEWAIRAI